MATLPALDLDPVRTLVFIAEEKSFTRAAERVGRTQSAVSLQVQRLEALVGHTLIARGKGGGVELTAHGEELVERGRGLLALNDVIVQSLRARPAPAAVRLGFDGGYARPWMPDILARFAAAQPAIAVETSRAGSCELVPKLKAGELDLIVWEAGLEPRQWPAIEVWRGRLEWITSDAHRRHLDDPLPLVLVPGNCPFRPPWLADCKASNRVRRPSVSGRVRMTRQHFDCRLRVRDGKSGENVRQAPACVTFVDAETNSAVGRLCMQRAKNLIVERQQRSPTLDQFLAVGGEVDAAALAARNQHMPDQGLKPLAWIIADAQPGPLHTSTAGHWRGSRPPSHGH